MFDSRRADRMLRTILIAVAIGAAILLSLSFCVGRTSAQEHRHNSDDPAHWYDGDCCNLRDCRPISGIDENGVPWTEIQDMGDVFIWQSSVSGRTYTIPRNGRKIRASRDGFYHGCETRGGHSPYGGEDVQTNWLCIYEPAMF